MPDFSEKGIMSEIGLQKVARNRKEGYEKENNDTASTVTDAVYRLWIPGDYSPGNPAANVALVQQRWPEHQLFGMSVYCHQCHLRDRPGSGRYLE